MKDSAWRWTIGSYFVARVALSVWAAMIALLFPLVLQNLDLFGAPILAAFDLATSERYAFSREVDGATLTFRAGLDDAVADTQTSSTWSLHEGRALSGKYAGQKLSSSSNPVEDIFPYRGVAPEQNFLLAVWQRFDTNWYLKIAQHGYSSEDGSTVYFPLYPMLIRFVGSGLGNEMLAALLISNLSLIGALVLLYREAESRFDAASTRRTIVYVLIFPVGFFLLAAYSESLFLLLTLGAWAAARRNRWHWAALLGALAALTRLQGVLLIVPLAWMWWVQVASSKPQVASSKSQVAGFRSSILNGSWLLLIPLATGAFLAFNNLSLLNSYEGELHARFVFPWGNFAASLMLLASGQGSFIDVFNLLITVLFGVMLIIVWRDLPREYGLYAMAMFLAPLFRMTTTQPLVSMARYVLVLFPVFMLWGQWGRNAWVNRAVVYLSFPLQMYLTAQFVMWGWVG